MTSSDSTAPRGLPGRLMMMDFPRIPAAPRESTARGVFCAPAARICSGNPGIIRSTTAAVASGRHVARAESRPAGGKDHVRVVRIRGFFEKQLRLRRDRRRARRTKQFSSRVRGSAQSPRARTSSDFPAATESLMVRTETRMKLRGWLAFGGFDVFGDRRRAGFRPSGAGLPSAGPWSCGKSSRASARN